MNGKFSDLRCLMNTLSLLQIPLGLSVAAEVRVGNFLGAGNPKVVKKTIKVALGLIGKRV